MAKSKSPPPPATPATNIQIVCQEPVIVSRDPDTTEDGPAENSSWPGLVFTGGTIAFLALIAWQAPAQLQNLWQYLIQQVFQWVHLP